MNDDKNEKENPLIYREKPYYTAEELELYYRIAIDECLKQGRPDLAAHYKLLLDMFLKTKDTSKKLFDLIVNKNVNHDVDENQPSKDESEPIPDENADQAIETAKAFYNQGEYEKAFPVFEKYADKGVAEAQIQIGRCYEYGNGVTQDEAKAVEWYKKAVDQDYDEGWCCLACCYELGIGIGRNYPKAAELYTIAAERGHPRAQNNLGSLYETGRGVEKNIKTALMWYTRAAEGGNKTAKRNLKRLEAEDLVTEEQ